MNLYTDDIDLDEDPPRPRCKCGAFLAFACEEAHIRAGYPGAEFDDVHYGRTCKRCGAWNE